VDACPQPIPIPKPTEAMIPCGKILSELPENFVNLTVQEAVEILSVNHAVDAAYFFECSRKHGELSGWIERNK
jgi:hypothetical protein